MKILHKANSLNVYRATVTGLRISAVDGGGTESGGSFIDALTGTLAESVGVALHSDVAVTGANSKISAVAAAAFYDDASGVNLQAHLGKYLVVKDSAGKKIKGWIKAAGTAETLGAEQFPDPGFADAGQWTPDNGWSVGSGIATRVSGTGYYLRDILSPTQVINTLYKGSIDVKTRTAGTTALVLNTIPQSIVPASAATGVRTGYITATVSGGYDSGPFANAADFQGTVDDVSIKQVLTPSATGVTISSTKNGTALDNWESKETGFNYNNTSGYTYTIYDRDITALADGNHQVELYPSSTPSGRVRKGVLKAATTTESLGAEINTGTCVVKKLYTITATEADHYGTGRVVGSYFESLGTETNDANNKVKVVLAGGQGSTIVTAKAGTTYNFSVDLWIDADKNQANNTIIIRKLR